jgi:hypothetical protein
MVEKKQKKRHVMPRIATEKKVASFFKMRKLSALERERQREGTHTKRAHWRDETTTATKATAVDNNEIQMRGRWTFSLSL